MIDGLIQIWKSELHHANAEVERYSDMFYESGAYLEGDSEYFWELPHVEEADARLMVAEQTYEALKKLI